MFAPIPNTITFCGESLARMKTQGEVPCEVLSSLREQADALLDAPFLSVVDRRLHAPTGNLHEYASMGPYWWPNPDTADGLPYIRRDGEFNPESVEEVTYRRMAERAHLLALAAYHFEDSRYGACAAKTLAVWHTEKDTFMTPHAKYAQCIPGICDGRGIGLIDFSFSYMIFDAVAILEAIGQIEPSLVLALKEWYVTFIDYMLTSENGLAEEIHHNNHGAWYDVQILAAARFTERPWLAKRVVKLAYDRRLKAHIRPDGSQPFELERTRAINYSMYNLLALTQIANMAADLGEQTYWGIDEQDGVCLLRQAFDFIAFLVTHPDQNPYTELDPQDVPALFSQLAMRMDAKFPGNGYAELARPHLTDSASWRAHPCL
ncbi:MAG: alginate lyase family protein [Clostridia bacterium]|nr:alginate lyase family protein [Clostridia bacterium]